MKECAHVLVQLLEKEKETQARDNTGHKYNWVQVMAIVLCAVIQSQPLLCLSHC